MTLAYQLTQYFLAFTAKASMRVHFLQVIMLLSLCTHSYAYNTIESLTTEESMLAEDYVSKTSRRNEIEQEIVVHQGQIKVINSRLLPLEIEMKKIKLEYKKIDVKKPGNRQKSETSQLSRIKYRQHILKLKIQVEEKSREDLNEKIATLHDRENRLNRVIKKLNRQLTGIHNEMAEMERESIQAAILLDTPPAPKKSTPPAKKSSVIAIKKSPASPAKHLKSKKSQLATAVSASKTPQVAIKNTAAPSVLKATPIILSDKELAKRRKILALLIQMNDIPDSTKAVIRAKHKALEDMSVIPNLGDRPEIELNYAHNKKQSETLLLTHLGNNQYMNTVSIKSGFQNFHIGALKFTKRIDSMYHGKKAVIIINAIDISNPIFEVYPVTLEKPEVFLY